MISKLRETLPECFSKYQEEYTKLSDMVKSCFKERAYIVDEDTLRTFGTKNACGGQTALVMLIGQHKIASQILCRAIPKVQDNRFMIRLSRTYDWISALYIPKDMQCVKLWANGNLITQYKCNSTHPELSDILEEARTFPETQDNLEYILSVAKSGQRGFVYNQDSEITIEGQTYTRIVMVQPMLSIVSCPFQELKLELSDNYPIYVETLMLDMEPRNKCVTDRMMVYVENEKNMCHVSEGMIFPKKCVGFNDELPPVPFSDANLIANCPVFSLEPELPKNDGVVIAQYF